MQDAPHARDHAASGLGLFAAGLAARALLGLGSGAVHALLLSSMQEGGASPGLAEVLGSVGLAVWIATLLSGAVMLWGLYELTRVRVAAARRPARPAFWAFAAGLGMDVIMLAVSLLERAGLELGPGLTRWLFTGLGFLGLGADCVFWVFLLVAAGALYSAIPGGDAGGRMGAAAISTALWLLYWLLQFVPVSLGGLLYEHPWVAMALRSGLGLAQAGAVLWLLLDVRKLLALHSVEGPPAVAGPSALGSSGPRVASGLRLYRVSLLVKLVVLVAGYALILGFALGEARESARGALLAVAVLGLLPGLGQLWGLVRYAAVPEETGARGAAGAAVAVGCLGLLADGAGLWLALNLMSEDYQTVAAAAEASPWIEGGAQVLGLVGLACLLTSFRRLAEHLRAEPLARRAGGLMVLAVVLVVGAVGLRAGLLRGVLPLSLGLVLVGAALIAVIALVGLFVQLVGRLARAVETGGERPLDFAI